MLFPPILNSTLPAFLSTTQEFTIPFSLAVVESMSRNTKVWIRVLRQTDNKNIVADKNYIERDFDSQNYEVSFSEADILIGELQAGCLYKIQIKLVDGANESEWSNVMIIKLIDEPTLEIELQNMNTLTPLLLGNRDLHDTDLPRRFKFNVFDSKGNFVLSSGWKDCAGAYDQYQVTHALENYSTYSVFYFVETVGGYLAEMAAAATIAENLFDRPDGITLSCKVDDENARVLVSLDSDHALFGNYLLSRASEQTDFTIWEELTYLFYNNTKLNNQLVYTDYVIEDGVQYKYCLQEVRDDNLRSSRIYEGSSLENSPARECNFEFAYFYDGEVQLALKFNNKISSYKTTVLEQKQDTLGSKYPVISRNGDTAYKEFPIEGMISLWQDFEQFTFVKDLREGLVFGASKLVPARKYKDLQDNYLFNTNQTSQNLFIERMFREKVHEFLNNGELKLFKSATEGNHIIRLMNISLTPEESLHRMIYRFNATAYEMADYDYSSLVQNGIIAPGKYQSFDELEFYTFGQLDSSGINSTINSAVEYAIKNEIAEFIPSGYSLSLDKLEEVLFEPWLEEDAKNNFVYLEADEEKSILVPMSKWYHLQDTSIKNFNVNNSLKYLVNYIAKAKLSSDSKVKKYGEISYRNGMGEFKIDGDSNIYDRIRQDMVKQEARESSQSADFNDANQTILAGKDNQLYRFTFAGIITLAIESNSNGYLTITDAGGEEQQIFFTNLNAYQLDCKNMDIRDLTVTLYNRNAECYITYEGAYTLEKEVSG